MKVVCENLVICGNYKCIWNVDGKCGHDTIAMDATGKCILVRPRPEKKSIDNV
jgi:hypothetical protein